mgnify:FL=1
MMKFRSGVSILAILMILGHLSISDAYAYLDPGSGSIIIQMLVGTLVGVGIVLKLYWQKFKMKFLKRY